MTARGRRCAIALVLAWPLALAGGCREGRKPGTTFAGATNVVPTRLVRDSRGVDVRIPATVRRLATISDGLVEEVAVAIDAPVEIVAVGSTCLTTTFRYPYETRDGERYEYNGGRTPAAALLPALSRAPVVAMPGTEINLEQLARSSPDVLVVHAGCCTTNWRLDDRARMAPVLQKLEALGIPTVVVAGPHFDGRPSVAAISDAIRIIGDVVGRREAAAGLASQLEADVAFVKQRTANVPSADRPRVLLFGLSPAVRRQGGAGTVAGLRSIESWILEDIVNARNAFRDATYSRDLNAEHVLALDPDAIALPTASGFHPRRELLEGPAFATLQYVRAVAGGRVASLPWTPCNCDKRLEYPLDAMVMAKLAYPQRFADIDVAAYADAFLQRTYRIDAPTARRVRDGLWLDTEGPR